jgi:signal transduction histidine kinase
MDRAIDLHPAYARVGCNAVNRLGSALRNRPPAVDALLAATLAVLVLWDTRAGGRLGGLRPVQIVAILTICLALIARRRAPLVAVAIIAAAAITQSLVSPEFRHNSFTEFVAVLIITYSLARYAGPRGQIVGAALLAALVTTIVLRDRRANLPGDLIEELALLAAAFAIGTVTRRRYEQTKRAERRTELVRGEQEILTRQAIAEERSRISRELHDLVAHGVGVMVVQAGAGRLALDHDTNHAKEAFLAIEDTGRHALADMRRLVGLLREGDGRVPASPQPGLGDIDPLVDRVRASGLNVKLDIRGTRRAISPGLDLAAYRIIQEALTNVLKHAQASRVDVTIDYRDTDLELLVTDDGCGPPPPAQPGGGHGLVGMRERVLLYGGELHTAARDGGGFELRARLPVEEVAR